MISGKGGVWRDKDRSDKLEAIARIMLLAMIGMFTGYTLVSLFGLIIGGALTFAMLWYFNKVINSNIDSDTDTNITTSRLFGLRSKSKPRIRYRCLSCYTIHNRAECPKCGSKMKQVEF